MAKTSTPSDSDSGAFRHIWLSPWTSWVGFRYLRSKKNSKFLSFITLISILGVMLGVTAMIVVLSVMDGFEAELKKRLMSSDLHVLVTPKASTPGYAGGYVPKSVLDPAKIQALVEANPGILSFWPVLSTEAILRAGKKVKGVVVKGVTDQRLAKLKTQVTESAEPQMMVQHEGVETIHLPGIFVGQELAFEMGVLPGDPVLLISPTETEGPMSSVPRLKRYVVEGIYKSGLPEQELSAVFATENAVRSFLRKSEIVSQWEITVRNFDDAPAIARQVRKAFPELVVKDWVQLNAHLFASLKLERLAMFVILAFIIIVASFNIVTTLTLMVLEKKREISILKAMGARNGQVAAIFLSEGVFIGTIGVGGGVILSWLTCLMLKRYEFITLPEVYYDRTLPVTFNPFYYGGVAICALLIVLTACLYPSKRAAQINPLDGIRFG